MCNKVQALKEHPRSTPLPKQSTHSETKPKNVFKKEAKERRNEKGVRSLSNQQVLFSAQAV